MRKTQICINATFAFSLVGAHPQTPKCAVGTATRFQEIAEMETVSYFILYMTLRATSHIFSSLASRSIQRFTKRRSCDSIAFRGLEDSPTRKNVGSPADDPAVFRMCYNTCIAYRFSGRMHVYIHMPSLPVLYWIDYNTIITLLSRSELWQIGA